MTTAELHARRSDDAVSYLRVMRLLRRDSRPHQLHARFGRIRTRRVGLSITLSDCGWSDTEEIVSIVLVGTGVFSIATGSPAPSLHAVMMSVPFDC